MPGECVRTQCGKPLGIQAMDRSGRDTHDVLGVVGAGGMCVACIMIKTGLELEPVLRSIETLEREVKVVRWCGRCPVCSQPDRAFFTHA